MILRVLLTSTPDIETPMVSDIIWVWTQNQKYPSLWPSWAQNLGSLAKHRVLGQHISFTAEIRSFEVWATIGPGHHMVGVRKKSHLIHQLGIKRAWFRENNFFEIPKIFGSFQLFSAETSKSRSGLKLRRHPIFFKRLGIFMKFYHKTLNLTNF